MSTSRPPLATLGRQLFGHRHAPVVATLLLFLPSLGAGFFADDFLRLRMLGGKAAIAPGPFDLFRFLSGDEGLMRRLIATGEVEWWADPHARLAFFRPLASLTHWLDHRLFGPFGPAHHLTSMVLWLLVVAAASALFRRIAPTPRAGTLAAWCFALADSHALPVTWVANRHAVLATLFSVLALWSWERYRRDGGARWATGTFASLGLGLLSGETAVGGWLLIGAFELFGKPEGRRPVAAWAGLALLLAVYAAFYRMAGYGAAHSSIYLDPLADPGRWLTAAATRLPMLLAGLLWAWPIDLVSLGATVSALLVGGALALVPASLFVFLPTARRHRLVGALALGGLAALLPLASTTASTRQLLLPSLPAALLLGTFVDEVLSLQGWRSIRAGAGALLGFRQVLLAPLVLAVNVSLVGASFRTVAGEATTSPWPADLSRRRLFLLGAPSWMSATYLGDALELDGRRRPERAYTLNLSASPAELLRPEPRTLVLKLRCGEMLSTPEESLLRSTPLPAGASVEAESFRATVLEAGRLGPTAVRFELSGDGDEDLFARWTGARYEPIELPPVGGVLELPGIAQGLGSVKRPPPRCEPADPE